MSSSIKRSVAHGVSISNDFGGALVNSLLQSGKKKSGGQKRRGGKVSGNSLVKSINRIGKATKDDKKIAKWVSSKRVKGAAMSAAVRQYCYEKREFAKLTVRCIDSDEHKISPAELRKQRLAKLEDVCSSCGAALACTLRLAKVIYSDANEYTEAVPYLTLEDTQELVSGKSKESIATDGTAFWNAVEYKLY